MYSIPEFRTGFNYDREAASDETKAKMSAALKGKTCSDETKAKISAALKK